jgi:hypothetical protein
MTYEGMIIEVRALLSKELFAMDVTPLEKVITSQQVRSYLHDKSIITKYSHRDIDRGQRTAVAEGSKSDGLRPVIHGTI